MTRNELKELSKLNAEAKLISDRIEELEALSNSTATALGGLPCSKVFLESASNFSDRIKKLKDRYNRKLKECFDTMDKLNDFIESIPDSELRMIFSLRYINNMPWQALAWHLGFDGDGSTERKKHDRYLIEINKKCA